MSEYERLKKQRDEIIKRQTTAMATAIVDDLMTDGCTNERAHRLVLTDCNNKPGSGWCRQALIDRIQCHLSNAGAVPRRDSDVGTSPLLGQKSEEA